MIDFSEQTYANILARQLERVPDSLDKREGSIIQTALGPESWYIEGLYLVLTQMQQNGFALFAVGEYLDYKAAERGLTRNKATAAKRLGIFNTSLQLGDRFSTIAGASSVTFYVSKYIGMDGANYEYELTCETEGTIGNDYTGALLPITFIQNLNFSEITSIIDDGTNEESDDSLRARYLSSLMELPFAGNIAAYRQAILAEDDIGAVQVYPVWEGGGTVKCSILNSNFDPASNELVERIQTKICPSEVPDTNPSQNGYGLAPIGAAVTIGTATPLTVNVSMTVQLSSGHTIESVRPAVNTAIENYLLGVRKLWGASITSTKIEYPVWVYVAQVTAAILAVDGVVNVTNTKLNGAANDLNLIETGVLQQLPMKGTVTING